MEYSTTRAVSTTKRERVLTLPTEAIALFVGFIAIYGLLAYQIAVGYGIYLQEKQT